MLVKFILVEEKVLLKSLNQKHCDNIHCNGYVSGEHGLYLELTSPDGVLLLNISVKKLKKQRKMSN